MSDSAGGAWPEQDAIDSWFKAHDLEFRNEILMVLKNEVTKPRIEVQKENEKLKADIQVLALALDEAADDLDEFNTQGQQSTNEVYKELAKQYLRD